MKAGTITTLNACVRVGAYYFVSSFYLQFSGLSCVNLQTESAFTLGSISGPAETPLFKPYSHGVFYSAIHAASRQVMFWNMLLSFKFYPFP